MTESAPVQQNISGVNSQHPEVAPGLSQLDEERLKRIQQLRGDGYFNTGAQLINLPALAPTTFILPTSTDSNLRQGASSVGDSKVPHTQPVSSVGDVTHNLLQQVRVSFPTESFRFKTYDFNKYKMYVTDHVIEGNVCIGIASPVFMKDQLKGMGCRWNQELRIWWTTDLENPEFKWLVRGCRPHDYEAFMKKLIIQRAKLQGVIV